MLGKRTRLSGAAASVAVLFGVAACSGGAGGADGADGGGGGGSAAGGLAACDERPLTCNSARNLQTRGDQRVAYAIEKNINNWNVNSIQGKVLATGWVMNSVLPEVYTVQPDLSPTLNTDVMVSAKQVKTSPQTIVYKIQPDATWMDGHPIDVDDFVYNWKVHTEEYCPTCTPATTSGYDQIASVEGSDGGKTVTVTFSEPYTDWKSLWGVDNPMYPAHIAARHGDLSTPQGLAKAFEWFGSHLPSYSGGPFKIQSFQDNVAVTLVPNENWFGKGPYLDRLIFRIITDAAQEPTALANKEVQVIAPQPQVDLIERVSRIPNVSYAVDVGLQWEHFDLNLENRYLAKEPLRDAMFTAIDRKAIIDKTVGQFTDGIQPLNNHNLMPGQEHYTDTVTATGHGSGNLQRAKQILKKAGYRIRGGRLYTPEGKKIPAFTIRYTTGNEIRQTEVELFKSMVEPLGIEVTVRPTSDLGGTLSSGQYDIIVFGWTAAPYPFNGAEQLWSCGSGSNFGNWCNKKATRLLAEAATSTNPEEAYRKLNKADRILSEAAYVLPLYQKPFFLAAYDRYANIRMNPTLPGAPYNTKMWGVAASAG